MWSSKSRLLFLWHGCWGEWIRIRRSFIESRRCVVDRGGEAALGRGAIPSRTIVDMSVLAVVGNPTDDAMTLADSLLWMLRGNVLRLAPCF